MWLRLTVLGLLLSTQLMAEVKVLAFSASTRENSLNQKLVDEAARIATEKGAKVTLVSLKDFVFPMYDPDDEAKQGMPEVVKKFRKLLIENDAVIIGSPEYNGSVSALLKNLIDWSSRSENVSSSREAFKGKKFLILSASPGQGGGARGLVHLKQIIENIGGAVTAQVTLPDSYSAFDDQGHIKNPAAQAQLKQAVSTLL